MCQHGFVLILASLPHYILICASLVSLFLSAFVPSRYAQLLADGEEDDADLLEKVWKSSMIVYPLHCTDEM